MRNPKSRTAKSRTAKLGAARKFAATGALALLLAAMTPTHTQNAIANGDTRTLRLYHTHTGESIQATFRVNGQYDTSVLEKLNHFLRDWRNDESVKMDPRLFDVVWETYRESGSQEPIHVVSSYRSPQTNAMLRRRSKAVAEFSQHMLGKAMDMHYLDVPMSRVREIAMRLQRGGVGYYPTAGSPFVHLDVGNVRAWPRMSYDQLARLFPDGKTVHLPPSGQPLARYEEARAEIETRGGVSMPTAAQVQSKGFFASLFGGEEEETVARAPRGGPRSRVAAYVDSRNQPKAPVTTYDDGSSAAYFLAEANRSPVIRQAERNLPRGETYAAPAPAPALAASPAPVAAPVIRSQPVQTAFAPLPPARPAEVFAAAMDPRAPFAPVPPRRPTDPPLMGALLALNTPLPPPRPSELRPSAPPRIADLRHGESPIAAPTHIARPTDLPPVITGAAPAAAPPALAYAPAQEPPTPVARPIPVPARPIARAPVRNELVAAKVDRATLTALIKTVSVAQLPSPAKAAGNRGEITRTIFAQPTPVAGGFAHGPTALSTGAFTGKAVVAVTARDINTLAKRQD